MAVDLSEIYEWARQALRSDEDTLPDDELTRIAKSSVRQVLTLYPSIKTIGGIDLVDLAEEDRESFDEAVGYLIAARWILLPRPDGEEMVIRLKIGQLEEQYKVADSEALLRFYQQEFKNAVRAVSFVGEALKQSHLDGKGRPAIIRVSPDVKTATALAALFSKRQVDLFGPDFDVPDGDCEGDY